MRVLRFSLFSRFLSLPASSRASDYLNSPSLELTIMNLVQDTSEQFPKGRFSVLNTEDQGRCATFEFLDEDHTLGNALRHMILKNPDVKFCGYALPHPNERKINLQIQVYKGEASDALDKGLRDLIDLNKAVRASIEEASREYGQVELEDSEEEDEERVAKLIQIVKNNK